MPEWTAKQMRAQWLLAGRLTGGLSVAQMIIFAIVLARTSIAYASVNFWLLVIGFSISGVTAVVCLNRSRPPGPVKTIRR
jgi:hypothetical protein